MKKENKTDQPKTVTVWSVYDLINKNVNMGVSFTQDRFKSLLTFGDMAAPNFNTWYKKKYGKVRLPSAIQTKLMDHYDVFVHDVQEQVLNTVSDQSSFMQQLKLLVHQDSTISDDMKRQLVTGESNSIIVAQIIKFAVTRNTSGLAEDLDVLSILENVQVPFWSKEVVGREVELEEIAQMLNQSNLLFLVGMGGIGKSVLAQEFARQNADFYHNRLFLSYRGSLRETITNIRFPGDQTMTEEERFEYVFGLLKRLNDENLIIIDNLDQLPEQSKDEALLNQLNSHVIITTRLHTWDTPVLTVRPLSDESLTRLFYSYCPPRKAGSEERVQELILLVNYHTYATQLLAQTVNEGFITSEELCEYIVKEGLSIQHHQIDVLTHKDGKVDYQPFYQLLVGLFPVIHLSDSCKLCLAECAMIPDTGVRRRTLGKWLGRFQELQLLIRLGWLQEDLDLETLYMHTLIRDMVFTQLKPTIEQCMPMIESILKSCDMIHHRLQVADAPSVDEILGCFPNIRRMMSIYSPQPLVNPLMMLFGLYGTLLCVRYIEREYDFTTKEPCCLDAGERSALAAKALEYIEARNLNVPTANGMTNRQLYDAVLASLEEPASSSDQTAIEWLKQAQTLYQEFLEEMEAWTHIQDVAVYQILSSMAEAMGEEPPEIGLIISS